MDINAAQPALFYRLRRIFTALCGTLPVESSLDTTVRLKRSQVLTIAKRSTACRLVVQQGKVWATSAPATGDFVLEAGAGLNLAARHPFVVEALTDSEIILSR